jgi:hypothetical protein
MLVVSTLFTLNFYLSFIGEFYRKNWDYFVARNVVLRPGTVKVFCEPSGIDVRGIWEWEMKTRGAYDIVWTFIKGLETEI